MSAKHTPAPWVYQPKDEEVIAPAVVWTGDIGGIPNEADGCLIAAAPEMLEALQAQEELDRIGLVFAAPGQIERVTELRRTAIAKATGK